MTDDASCYFMSYFIAKKNRGVLYYLHQVNGGDYVFIGIIVLCVCLCAAACSGQIVKLEEDERYGERGVWG